MAKDLFSGHAKEYAAFRPSYPDELIGFIIKRVSKFDQAWDCGTGSGQVARKLAPLFRHVEATDISTNQLDQALRIDNVTYQFCKAEESPFSADTFDLICVGQAVHWFDLEKFFIECNRVARRDAIIALFGYSLVRFNDTFNVILDRFYNDFIYSYWEGERKIVDSEYQSIQFPFDEIPSRKFKMEVNWSMADLAGYLNTWSSVQKYIKVNKVNPVNDLMSQLSPLWNGKSQAAYFPIFLRLGRISK